MGKNQFKISAKYWESLSEKEKLFFQQNACDHGILECKGVISMCRKFCGEYSEIVNFSHYAGKEYGYSKTWLVINNDKISFTIFYAPENIGLKRHVRRMTDNGLVEVWNDYSGYSKAV